MIPTTCDAKRLKGVKNPLRRSCAPPSSQRRLINYLIMEIDVGELYQVLELGALAEHNH